MEWTDSFKQRAQWYHHYQLVNIGSPEKKDVIEHLQLVFVELPKFPVQSPTEKCLRLLL